MICEKIRGVPLVLLHEILTFCPNFNANVEVPAVVKQFPVLDANENADKPPITKLDDNVYPI